MATSAEESASSLFRVFRTVNEMLNDRGYLVVESDLKMKKEDFRAVYGDDPNREELKFIKQKRDNPEENICIFFELKVATADLRKIVKTMQDSNVARSILITKEALKGPTRNAIERLAQQGQMKLVIEHFLESDLVVNITHHELVPKHNVLSEAEKKTLLERYTVKEHQLPRILKHDPIARYFGLSRGQIVRIARNSETAGKYINYRIVL